MQIRAWLFLSCLATAMLAATSLQCFAAPLINVHRDASLSPGTATLKGYISGAAADQVLVPLRSGQIKVLVVNSVGGEELAAIRIGEEIVKRDITLVVDGACMSACASYLFLPALHRKVMPYSLVAFHHSSISLLAMVPSGLRGDIVDHHRVAEARAKSLFASRKLPLSLLLEPQVAVRTRCYALLKNKSEDQAEIAYQSEFVAWMPSREYLKGDGIEFDGFWPETISDIRASWARIFPKGEKGRVAIGGPYHLASEAELRTDLQQIPKCPLAESTIRSLVRGPIVGQ